MAERETRLEPRPGRTPLNQGVTLPDPPPPGRPASGSCPAGSTVQMSPLSFSTWIAREAVTTETP